MADAAPLEYASSCYIPTSWLPLPLVAKEEYNYDSTMCALAHAPRCRAHARAPLARRCCPPNGPGSLP